MIVEKGTFQVLQKKGQLETETLGACIAVAALDRKAQVGGLWVFILPAQKLLHSSVPRSQPAFFADQGLRPFFQALKQQGAELSQLELVIAGGARFLEAPTVFDLGGLNASMIRKLFKDLGITSYQEYIGGPFPRRVVLDISAGTIRVCPGEEEA